jgi:hypothetical protein
MMGPTAVNIDHALTLTLAMPKFYDADTLHADKTVEEPSFVERNHV